MPLLRFKSNLLVLFCFIIFINIIFSLKLIENNNNYNLKKIRNLKIEENNEINKEILIEFEKEDFEKKWFLRVNEPVYFFSPNEPSPFYDIGAFVIKFLVENSKVYIIDSLEIQNTSYWLQPKQILESYDILEEYSSIDLNKIVINPLSSSNNYFESLIIPYEYYQLESLSYRYCFNFKEYNSNNNNRNSISFQQYVTFNSKDYSNIPIAATNLISFSEYYESESMQIISYLSNDFYPTYYFDTFSWAVPKIYPQYSDIFISYIFKYPLFYNRDNNQFSSDSIIEYVVSRNILDYRLPSGQPQNINFYDAVAKGILSWNKAFGQQIIRVRLATEQESDLTSRSDINAFLWDNMNSYEYCTAFANPVINPTTGELLNCNVYFPSCFYVDPNIDPTTQQLQQSQFQKSQHNLNLNPFAKKIYSRQQEQHSHHTHKYSNDDSLNFNHNLKHNFCDLKVNLANPTKNKDKSEKDIIKDIEDYVASVAAHEIGHCLGLRHNFAGSIFGDKSSTVMDYIDYDYVDDVIRSYDIDAIEHLYKNAPAPTQPFCTDEDVTPINPSCARYDNTSNPINTYTNDVELKLKKNLNELADTWCSLYHLVSYAIFSLSTTEQNQALSNIIDLTLTSPNEKKSATEIETLNYAATQSISMLSCYDISVYITNNNQQKIYDAFTDIVLNENQIWTQFNRRFVLENLQIIQHSKALETLLHIQSKLTTKSNKSSYDQDLIKTIENLTSPFYYDYSIAITCPGLQNAYASC
eukprot:TRINITY_DN1158_c0_g2_i1.p1 TRINITY_DN1158_c0_g2~~TRINITY_DN1158_c0_g2_i1.p1  ORF type:complete len:753 (+),score=290.06 TRINITY_DN1158_c0_g2_i1:50-2308(+)